LPLMIHDTEPEVRRTVARRIASEWLGRLATDEDSGVRAAVAERTSFERST
jgi:Leucine rich repeat variant